jgi:hypothetical protein
LRYKKTSSETILDGDFKKKSAETQSGEIPEKLHRLKLKSKK